MSYEHARKLRNGEAYPSDELLDKLADTLKTRQAILFALRAEDQIEYKFGPELNKLVQSHPELAQLAPAWELLTPSQKQFFATQIEMTAENNLKTEKVRGTPTKTPTTVKR